MLQLLGVVHLRSTSGCLYVLTIDQPLNLHVLLLDLALLSLNCSLESMVLQLRYLYILLLRITRTCLRLLLLMFQQHSIRLRGDTLILHTQL